MSIDSSDMRMTAATLAQMQQAGVYYPKMYQQQSSQDDTTADSVKPSGKDSVSVTVEIPRNTVDTLQKIGNISDFLNSVAHNIRKTNEGLSAVNGIATQMRASLDKIIKNYPPFPIDSKERMQQLMEYSSLQKQILGLMLPPPPQPVYEKVKHLWEGLTSGIAGTIQTPSLPQNAPDSHVQAAATQLDAISGQIGLVQDQISNSVRTN